MFEKEELYELLAKELIKNNKLNEELEDEKRKNYLLNLDLSAKNGFLAELKYMILTSDSEFKEILEKVVCEIENNLGYKE